MDQDRLETGIMVGGAVLAAIGAALCVPSVRRRVASAAQGRIERLGELKGREVAASAGSAAAKAALTQAGMKAAMTAKDQLLG